MDSTLRPLAEPADPHVSPDSMPDDEPHPDEDSTFDAVDARIEELRRCDPAEAVAPAADIAERLGEAIGEDRV